MRASRNFTNKLWNASRFILMNRTGENNSVCLPERLELEDRWVLSKYNRIVKEVTENLEKFELGIALQKLYDFVWDVVCDWYIELCKARLAAGGQQAADACQVLIYVLSNTLKLLHPYIPFITEEIWQALPHEGESIMISPWPEYDEALNFAGDEADFEKIMDVIKAVRTRRAEMNVPPKRKAQLLIDSGEAAVFQRGVPFFERLASASQVQVGSGLAVPENAVQIITNAARVYIPMEDLVDREQELARLQKEKEKAEKDQASVRAKLANESFVAKAPAQVVQAERDKLALIQDRLEKIEASIRAMQ